MIHFHKCWTGRLWINTKWLSIGFLWGKSRIMWKGKYIYADGKFLLRRNK